MDRPPHTEHVARTLESLHADTVDQVVRAVGEHDVVVVGMAWNPHVPKARRALDSAGIPHHYLGYGNYLWGWQKRLAIKLWSGWPTFPQVFVRGTLVGGASTVARMLAAGELQQMLEGDQG